ncbi:hypothetical protein E6C27_scaffold21G002310 [Cucumis melo var. makuwa]|uniref:Uncharacterized protein n=1 Tax=Cucumis melo var. makuwa TaxID=1194695 RepID=A0A5A7VDF7_CUCMM|nr:hypothetical protein E6C27_scaffold21G002310 [Cucumis melo var. makuwa]
MGLYIWFSFWDFSFFYSPTIGGSKIVVVLLEDFVALGVKIKMDKIPMKLWTEASLDVVDSAIGKPLTLDLATKE